MGNDNYKLSFLERLSSSQRVTLYWRFHCNTCTVVQTFLKIAWTCSEVGDYIQLRGVKIACPDKWILLACPCRLFGLKLASINELITRDVRVGKEWLIR